MYIKAIVISHILHEFYFTDLKYRGLEILCPDVLLPYFRKVKTNQVEHFLRCLIECQVILGMW